MHSCSVRCQRRLLCRSHGPSDAHFNTGGLRSQRRCFLTTARVLPQSEFLALSFHLMFWF